MTDVLRHRGPDDDGFYASEYRLDPPYGAVPGVGLGFRRLSIIDLAGGHQPMCNEDGTVWIVFNGEIYNFPELRHRLEGAGHRFATRSDTETIVHLYEDEGAECFRHLNGMFAVAIWDGRRRQLVLGRDRLGKKPLVYRHEPGRLSFASELKSLLEVPGTPRDIDPNALDEYLTYQYVPHPNTIFRSIRKLPPGHYAVYREDQLAGAAVLGAGLQRRVADAGSRGDRAAARDAGVVRGHAAAERSAAGRVPVRRCRFLADRRDRPTEIEPAAQDVFDRVPDCRVRRDALCAPGRRAFGDGASRVPGHAGRRPDSAAADLALR